jgi:DNA-binding transcriptional regulator YhcF (GntR family)
MAEWVRVDSRAAKPLFDQLRTQVIEGVRNGQLPAGVRLPTVRELARELGLAVNTVAAAARTFAEAARSLGVAKPDALRYVDLAFG